MVENGSYREVSPKNFCHILFWPLQLVGPEKDGSIGWVELCQKALKDSVWEREPDLLGRGAFSKENDVRYAEFLYFHPYVQQFLYPHVDSPSPPPMALFVREDIKGVKVCLKKKTPAGEVNKEGEVIKKEDTPERCILLDVTQLHLYVFDVGIAILLVELTNHQSLNIRTIQDFQDQFRRVFPPGFEHSSGQPETESGAWEPLHFPDQVKWLDEKELAKLEKKKLEKKKELANNPEETDKGENLDPPNNNVLDYFTHVEKTRTPPVAPHWAELLSPLTPQGYSSSPGNDVFYRQLGDDRCPFMTYLAIEDPVNLPREDMIRLACADGGYEGYPYSKRFLENFEKDHCYDCFWDESGEIGWMTTRTVITGHGFLYLGNSKDSEFFVKPRMGARDIFRFHYARMGLIAHFQKAALLMYSNALANAIHPLGGKGAKKKCRSDVNTVLDGFLKFTHLYWFPEISAQEQGKVLFGLWTRHLDLKTLFEEVKFEAQTAYEYQSSEKQIQLADAASKITFIGALFLAPSLVMAFWGMDVYISAEGVLNWGKIWYQVFLPSVFGVFLLLVLMRWRRARNWFF